MKKININSELKESDQVSLRFRDISLSRLYGILYSYCCLYSDYSFNITRYNKYYELVFNAWGDSIA